MKYLNTREMRWAVLQSILYWITHPRLKEHRRKRCRMCVEAERAAQPKPNCTVCPATYFYTRCEPRGGRVSVWYLWHTAEGAKRLFWAYVIVAGLLMLWVALALSHVAAILHIGKEAMT